MSYVNDSPYLMIPRDVWENLVAFSEMASADVHAVLFNAIHQHLRKHSENWPEERKIQFSNKLRELRELRNGVDDADDG